MSTQTKFTDRQIEDWRAFEIVRSGGMYNMFDPAAREETGLTADEYRFVMNNYAALKEAAKS